MIPRLLFRLASLASLGLALLALADGPAPVQRELSEPDRETMLALLDEGWETLGSLDAGRSMAGEWSELHEALRLRMRAATSLQEARRVLSDLLRAATQRPLPQGQEAAEASISASRTPTWFPARGW